ncbi:MAG: hypothetical protein DRP45_10025 [Candidatus Zixiibacteriota bacterium]|nr:MAG: hypothetical protein DRP45_10025 [candidate division Zixibacteria bacterium]
MLSTHRQTLAFVLRFALVAILACVVLIVAGCDKDDRRISMRFKFKPGMRLTYEEVDKGTLRRFENDSLTHDTYEEMTWDIEWYVRQIFDDQTAEIVDTKTWRCRSWDQKDTTVVDTSKSSKTRPIVMYVQPDGGLVDMATDPEKSRYGLGYLKSYYEQCVPVFPKGDLTEGYSWTQTTKVVVQEGPMEASTTYTVKSFARERGYDCVVIEYNGTVIVPLEPMCYKDSSKLISGVDNITASGHLYFAYKEGVIVMQTERWIKDGVRRVVLSKGDTVSRRVLREIDVHHFLLKLEME